jgi:molybdenum cofactor cytidylyltransferase
MKFGPVPIGESAGAVLAHSLRAGKQVFKKGRRLSPEDAAALAAAGFDSVVAARFGPDDVPEDEAATRIAEAACGENLERQAPFTGRCNLYSTVHGVAAIDRDRVDKVNLLDEAVTFATVPPFDVVEPGLMVATAKIIPLSAPRAAVEEAARVAAEGGPLVRVAAFRPHRAGLVMTRLPGTKETVLDKTAEATRERLAAFGSTLIKELRCAHEADAIGEAIRACLAEGCAPVLVFGASAITDRRDEIPSGVLAAGGEIVHFGMPVDPGNLLLLGRQGDVPVVGLPGCARSPKLNGFDWVLQRLLAGLEVGPRDIMLMGSKGLLVEIPTRPQPRAGERAKAQRAPRIAALVLAAGQSRRMGKTNKLLAEVEGAPMVTRAVDAALASKAKPVVVVTGHEREAVEVALKGRDVRFAHNPDYAQGLSASLKAGLAALPAEADGVVVMLGDMPRVTAEHVNRLIAAYNPVENRSIVIPTHRGKRGNPALFARRFLAEMTRIAGDVGAKGVIGQHADEVAEVPFDDDGVLLDIDTPQALKNLQSPGG